MIENKLILLLRRSKSLTPKFSESKFSKWKTYSTPSTESQSSFYYSRIIPSVKTSITGSFIGCGIRSLLQNNVKNFHIRSFRNFSTAKSTNAKGTEGLKLLVTAGSNAQEVVGIWLFVSAAWVYSMVVLGGVTRLAKSGLPMTGWKFTGRLPLSNDDWLAEFEKYKQSHDYKRLMYYMEYAHVLWGRSLAVMFGVPFSYFLLKGYITLLLGLRLSGLFALCAGQGLIGRWTAKCSEEPKSEFAGPRVSFYHLAAHSISTFVVYSGLFWTALSVAMPESPAESIAWVQQAAKVKRFVLPASFIVGITAISGAFVAESGGAFSASSHTSEGWVSNDVFVLKTQLVHQVLAAASLLAIGGLWWSTRTPDIPPALRPLIGSTIGIAAVQVSLGTAPLLSTAPPSLGTLHQAGVLTLLTLAIYLNHIVRRPSSQLLKTLSSVSKTIT
ncbi:cytochrome c oxidase assembly protein COX15-like isoform X3 [Salvia splendens]|uniref:cytochrome c oxidase assembly protein COX15-like isoform X3 n=1 Tax=Salvia splendens TaxID=180675 RepID=UPI001C26E6BF|nr:cytochrome c oxidase assembly protein COX15-like isoform X3 [Salvia splendens]